MAVEKLKINYKAQK